MTRFCLLYFRGLGKQGYQCQGEKDTSHVIERLLIVFSPGLGNAFHRFIGNDEFHTVLSNLIYKFN